VRSLVVLGSLVVTACGQGPDALPDACEGCAATDAGGGGGIDGPETGGADATTSGGADAGGGTDAVPATPDATIGIIGGGPCLSGAPGATGYRVRWADGGGTAYPVYEVNGLPDTSRDHTGAYGYQIGFTPQFVDPFLGDGGLLLDSSDFIDIEITTAGVTSISSATLSIFGRSFHVTTSGSFHWQTFVGLGAAPTNLVSNVPPYQWYSADMTTELAPNDPTTLIRIKAGPASGVLVVNRVELCLVAS
jgi:hypothetical protein